MLHQHYPLLRPVSQPVWELLNKWELLCPVVHRTPLPYVTMKAMFSVAMCLGWKRWAAVLLLGFEGLARVGEVLNATRMELVLPDLKPPTSTRAQLSQPKKVSNLGRNPPN